QKDNPGEKFEKVEPQKPKFSVARRDVKSYNEAQKLAFNLDKELEARSKNGKGAKNGKGGGNDKNDKKDAKSGKNGKNGKSGKNGQDPKGKDGEKSA
ncbi:MAG: hypothetical protein ACRD2T_12570, partial [Thermoanaerobaculia bacterium]